MHSCVGFVDGFSKSLRTGVVGEGVWRAQRRGDLEGILLLAVADIVGDVVVGGGC